MGDAGQRESQEKNSEEESPGEEINENAAEPRLSKTGEGTPRPSQSEQPPEPKTGEGTPRPSQSQQPPELPQEKPTVAGGSPKPMDKAVQVPYVDSWVEGPNDKGIQVYDGRSSTLGKPSLQRVSIEGESELEAKQIPSSEQLNFGEENDECVCTCPSHANYNKQNTRPSGEGEDVHHLEDEIYVGVLKITNKQVSFAIFNVPRFDTLYLETEKLSTTSPQPGHIEQNASDLVRLSNQVINKATYKCSQEDSNCVKNLKAVGITNAPESIVAWDSETSAPLSPIILGKDTRANSLYEEMAEECGSRTCLVDETGMQFIRNAPALKMRWLLDNVPEVAEANSKGQLRMGTLDTWMAWNLSNGKLFITDHTNAARTMLMNIQKCEWDPSLLQRFGIDSSILPNIVSSSEKYGQICNENCSVAGVDLTSIICMPNSALIGTNSIDPGNAMSLSENHCSHVMVNTGNTAFISRRNMNTTVAYKIGPSSTPVYAFEGVVSGLSRAQRSSSLYEVLSFSFFRRSIDDASLAVRDMELGRVTGQTDFILKAAEEETGQQINKLYIVGENAASDNYLQTQANMSNVPVYKPSHNDPTLKGTAVLAAHGEDLFAITNGAMKGLTKDDLKYVRNDEYEEQMDMENEEARDSAAERAERPSQEGGAGGEGGGSQRTSAEPTGTTGDGGGRSSGSGGGGRQGGFPLKLEDIDLRTALLILLIALLLMFLGHVIGKAFTKEPPPQQVFIRKCPRK